jgi:hypothetical protein
MQTNPPPEGEVAGRVLQCDDDKEEKVMERINAFNENRDALCSVFIDQVRRCDADRAEDVVSAAICKIIETGADAAMEAGAAKIQAQFRGKQVRKKPKEATALKQFGSEREKWMAFKGAVVEEAKAGGYQVRTARSGHSSDGVQ